jgi:hypothetical protein
MDLPLRGDATQRWPGVPKIAGWEFEASGGFKQLCSLDRAFSSAFGSTGSYLPNTKTYCVASGDSRAFGSCEI